MYTGWISGPESTKDQLTKIGVILGDRDAKTYTWYNCKIETNETMDALEKLWGKVIWGLEETKT